MAQRGLCFCQRGIGLKRQANGLRARDVAFRTKGAQIMEPSLAAVVAAIPLPTVIIGVHERIVNANPAATELFGANLDGRHHVLAFRYPALLEAIERCLKTATPGQAAFERSQGNRAQVLTATITPLKTASLQGVMVCFEDVTARREADQMRRDFVANVSHELRSPLTAILGFVETIRGAARDDPQAQDRFLTMLETEAKRMSRLVADLLSLSRVEAEERNPPKSPVDLSLVLDTARNRVLSVAEERDVTLCFRSEMPDNTGLLGDADQLSQVFTNLFENAIKYGRVGGEVTVSVTRHASDPILRGPALCIAVQDQGPGIPRQHLPRLTERFYRVDGHRSRQMGGTGLGLAIVKHILGRHRGRLQIQSQPGKGSCFSVILPVS